jgi:hypothetical protein
MKLVCSKNLYNNSDDSLIEYRKYKLTKAEKQKSKYSGYRFVLKEHNYTRNQSTGCYVLMGTTTTKI